MTKKRTIVEINGRKYDANSGQIIMDGPINAPVIDGFTAPKRSTAQRTTSTRKINSASVLHNKTQKTEKLHPLSLKTPKPAKKVTSTSKVIGNDASKVYNQDQTLLGDNSAKTENASHYNKSRLVTKFRQNKEVTVSAPKTVEEPDQPASTRLTKPSTSYSASAKKQATQPTPEKEKKTNFLKRLSQKRPRLATASLSFVILLALGGYVVYKNIPGMALRVAAQRAGFNASLPGYSPSGFAFTGPVAYSEGIVELGYQSNSDDRNFRLIQRESSWDSQSLLDNFVISTSDDYLTFQEKGLTVYIYGTSNATWVNGGIWYVIDGQSLLSSEQLLKIASSL